MISCKVIALVGVIAGALLGQTIHLKSRDIDTAQQDETAGLLKQRNPGKSRYLLQFNGPIKRESLDELSNRGAVITSFIPDNGVMVAAGNDFTVEGLDVKWIGRLQPKDKVSSALTAKASPAVNDDQNADVGSVSFPSFVVEFHSDVDMDDARDMMVENGLAVLTHPDLLPTQL